MLRLHCDLIHLWFQAPIIPTLGTTGPMMTEDLTAAMSA